MRAQATCNLIATLAHPPWKESLRRNVYMTMDGEKRIPFPIYIRSDSAHAPPIERSITSFRFNHLATKLQLRILAFCPPSTLFQLMHVSSTLRTETSKLFWAEPSAYFLVEAEWLLEGAYPGCTSWDMTFLAQVENIEVKCCPSLSAEICPRPDGILNVRQNLITTFWDTLAQRFPKVKNVVLNHNDECISWEDRVELFPLSLQLLLRASPLSINASTLVLERENRTGVPGTVGTPLKRWQRSVYQLQRNGLWKKSKPDKCRKTVMMPAKQFIGPVGEFKKLRHDFFQNLHLQRYGLWPLMVEALDRYQFDDGKEAPFPCAIPDCHAYLDKPGAWTLHAAESHFQEWERLLDTLPSSIKVEFENRIHVLEAKTEEIEAHYERIRTAWNEEGGVRRKDIERGWVEQLDNDEAWKTGDAARESLLWAEFLERVYVEDGGS